MKTTLYYVGIVWLCILGALVLIGSLGILFTKGIWEFWAVMSPFNFVNWILIAVLALPGVVLLKLSGR